jgi:hypothetical protein
VSDLAALTRQYDAESPVRQLIVGRCADVQPEQVRWLWPGRLPLGKLCILDGDPGLGKSLLTLDLAARVSTGRPMPSESIALADPAAVLLLSAEDGLADTIRPRLDALGADPALIHAIVGVRTETNGEETVTLPIDLGALEAVARNLRVRLIVIDPIMAYIDGQVNTRIDHDVRRLLAPLARIAETTGATVVAVRHLNKSTQGSALYRGGGSIAFIGAARAGLLVARDPDDAEKRVLAVSKMNLAPEPPSLSFTIEAGTAAAPKIRWLGETQHRADELVGVTDEPQEAGDLKTYLRELLEIGPRTFPEVRTECRKAGFDVSDRSLRRARNAVGVSVRRQGFGPGSVMIWSLNGHTGHVPDIADALEKGSGMTGMGRYEGKGDGLERLGGKGDAAE